jgi:aryl-alcohol dehydrogenase-like predicted oxidoreductase
MIQITEEMAWGQLIQKGKVKSVNYLQLGRSGLRVSRLAFGTVNLGRLLTPIESLHLLDEAVDLGINFIDTADEYAFGLSERIIGDWLTKNPGKRNKIVLATKVFEQTGLTPNERGLSAYHIKRACEASLKRLQTDHIDLYQMHHIDRSTPWPEIWQAMNQLIQEGKITYVGSSNFAAWHIAQAQAHADKRGYLGLISEQSIYNLSNRTVELEVLPACQAMGIAFLPYSPLQDGLFAGGLDKTKSITTFHSSQNDNAFIKLFEKMGLGNQQANVHPLTQFYNEHINPQLRQQLQQLANESFQQTLPEKRRPDFIKSIFQQLVKEYGQHLSANEKSFFVEYGTSRDQGSLSRSTFWRSILKLKGLRSQLESYEQLCLDHNYKPAELALAWLNSRQGITSIIIGPRTSAHLKSCISSLSLEIPDEINMKLDALFPGFGAAPEAYAW